MGSWIRNLSNLISPWRRTLPVQTDRTNMNSDMSLTDVVPQPPGLEQFHDAQEEPIHAPYPRTSPRENPGLATSTPVLSTTPTLPNNPQNSVPVGSMHTPRNLYVPRDVPRKHKEPMRYDGRSDWNDYLGHFMAVAEWNEWNLRECGLQLACSLIGEAREVLGSLPPDIQNDYRCLTQALERRFSPPGRESRYSLELMNRSCRPGEDIASYGHELRRLASRAYPDQLLDERVLVNLFVKGLPNKDMKRHVHLDRPRTLAEAIDAAISWEAFDEPSDRLPRKPRETPAVAAVSGKPYHPAPVVEPDPNLTSVLEKVQSALVALDGRIQTLEQKGGRSNRGPYRERSHRPDIICYGCGEAGHIKRRCPRDSHPEPASSSNQGSTPTLVSN